MNAHPTTCKAGLIILLMLLGFNSFLYAQATADTEEIQHYEELLKYQTSHTIEQEEHAESLSETMTGIGLKTPDDVFLAELVVTEDSGKLKKAELPDAIDDNVPVGDYEFVEYDDLFAEGDSEKNSGFGVGASAGHCPPGGGVRF